MSNHQLLPGYTGSYPVSDTPKTDAAIIISGTYLISVVPADFARDQERTITELVKAASKALTALTAIERSTGFPHVCVPLLRAAIDLATKSRDTCIHCSTVMYDNICPRCDL